MLWIFQDEKLRIFQLIIYCILKHNLTIIKNIKETNVNGDFSPVLAISPISSSSDSVSATR